MSASACVAVEEPEDDSALLYYSSLPVWLLAVPGRVMPFLASEWSPDASSAPAVVARASPGGGLPPELHDVVVPAVPSLDLVQRAAADGSDAAAEPPLPLPPELLRSPLLKVPPAAVAASGTG